MSHTLTHEPGVDPDDKAVGDTTHYEDMKVEDEVIVDTEARGYIDHTVVIDEATNRRLYRMITWR